MRLGILLVPFLALVLIASDAPGQQIKRLPGPPVQNTAEEEEHPEAEGTVITPVPLKPQMKTLGGSDRPLGSAQPSMSKTLPTARPDSKVGLDSSPPGGLGARKKRPNIHLSCENITCIERVRVNPKGNEVGFEVVTTKPARLFVEVGLMKPANHKFSKVERAIFTVPYRISSVTKITQLKPNHTYHWVVQAKGEDGVIQWSQGAFSTSGRRVDVVIQNIHVSNDGDDVGPGEFVFLFKVMNYEYALRTEIDTGSNKTVNKTISVAGVPPNLRIEMSVNEDDGLGMVLPRPGTGENYSGTYNVETSGEQETRNFSLSAANGEYALVVTGKLIITHD